MKLGKRTILAVEVLEDRAVPAVAASVLQGSLVVTGDSSSRVVITALDSNADKVVDTFKVVDGSTTVGTFRGVTKDLSVRLGAGNTDLAIDLGGLAAPRDLRVDLGSGNDALALVNGTVKGDVRVHGGFGTDKVAFGGTTLLAVNGNVNADLGGSVGDSFQLKGQATVKGSLTVHGVTSAALDAGSVVSHDVFLSSGQGGIAAKVDGQVGGNVRVLGDFFGAAGRSLSVTGKVGGGVLFVGSDKADKLSVTGTVGGDLTAILGRGDDTATVGGTIGGGLVLDAGPGTDAVTLAGSVGKRIVIMGGAGDDALVVTATAKLRGPADILLGSGNDKFTLDGKATITPVRVSGGEGTNTFVGSRTRAGLTLIRF